MPRVGSTGLLRLFWVPDPDGDMSAVTLSAPKASEINAGTELTPFLRRDGLSRPQNGNTIDVSDVSSAFNKTGLGTYGGDTMTVQLYRDSVAADDDAYTLLVPRSYGFACELPFGTAGASPAAADRAVVYYCGIVSRSPNDIADNDAQRFTVALSVQEVPFEGVLAASA